MDKVYVVPGDAAEAAAAAVMGRGRGWRPCTASVNAVDHLSSGVRHDGLVWTPALPG